MSRLLVSRITRPMGTLLLVIGLLVTDSALAQRLEIIELQHRPAEQLVPLLRPFVAQGGTLTGQRSQLFVRTTPQNLAEIKRLLDTLDRAPQQLLITVLQGEAVKLAHDQAQLDASLGVGSDGRVAVGRPKSPGDSAELRIRSTRSRHRGEDVQQVRVLEGSAATLYLGQSIPVGSRSITRSPWGSQTTDSVEYRNVTTGFSVIPRLSGERVTLEIATQRDSLSGSGGGRINIGGVQTTVSGVLGGWLELGGAAEISDQRRSGIIDRNTRDQQTERRILIRVERVP